jgi:hypothetical protein
MKSFIIAALTVISFGAFAAPTVNNIAVAFDATAGMDWKVGDTANYNVSIGGFINGTMIVGVKSVTSSDLVITEDIDLGFAGKQNCEMTIDPTTGKNKKMTCNGQDQQGAEDGDVSVLEMKEASITVPAGTFACIYIKAHSKSQNTDIEQWANPKLIPVLGMIKTATTSQMGPVNMELTSFKKM